MERGSATPDYCLYKSRNIFGRGDSQLAAVGGKRASTKSDGDD